MLQTSFANDSLQQRREYLAEEIERSLKEVVDSKRPEYLNALAGCFPGREQMGDPLTGRAPVIESVEKTTDELAEELIDRLPEFSKEAKARLTERFRLMGFIDEPVPSLDLPPGIRGKLGLTPDQALDQERVTKLLTALLEIVVTLDNLIWSLWKTMAPKSTIQRETGDGFRRTVGRYLAGDREVATLQINQMLDKTRHLFAGILSAIGPTGETYARQHLETFAPEKIRASVETGGFLTNLEQKCWRRYVVLAGELNGPAIEKQIVDTIAGYTEEIVSGRRRGAAEAPNRAIPLT
jgi:hypothetical protein